MDNTYVFVDIETNGGTGERGRVIEVAAIKVMSGVIVDEFQTLVNPGMNIPYWITTLTGITNSDLEHAPYFRDIADQLYSFMGDAIFVAHNVLFDYSFLKREFKAIDYTFSPKLYCTVKMSRALYPEHKGHSLQKIIERHKLSPKSRHRAYDDARMMYEYMQIAIKQKGVEAFQNNVALQLKTKTLPPNVEESVILTLPETAGIYIFEDDTGMPIYVGKSVNIRARVRSHFTNATTIAKEMKMSLGSHNVTFVQTETEVEALLLESAKVKELQPLYNRKLRRKKTQHVVIKYQQSDYITFAVECHDLSTYGDLTKVYGVFSTKQQAKAALESVVRTYQLCPKLMGLEKSQGVCFRYQLGLCKGACDGKESADSYNTRAEFALERMKIDTWPYKSKVGIAISAVRTLVVDQWIPLGIYDSQSNSYSELPNNFDIDTYKIIRSFLKLHKPKVTLLTNDEWLTF